MKILLKTIPHNKQRYKTCGDWQEKRGQLGLVLISKLSNPDHEFLVAVHELVEGYLCTKRGIQDADIVDFDKNFEEEKEDGKHPFDAEAGFSKDAPYRKEHAFATKIERLVAEELGVNWKQYDAIISNL